MIDVSHSSSTDLSQHFAHTNHDRQPTDSAESKAPSKGTAEVSDDEEAAWLQSVQAPGFDTVTPVQGLQSGALVLDMGRLRQEQTPLSAKKALQHAAQLPSR